MSWFWRRTHLVFCVTSGTICHGLPCNNTDGHDGICSGKSGFHFPPLTLRKTRGLQGRKKRGYFSSSLKMLSDSRTEDSAIHQSARNSFHLERDGVCAAVTSCAPLTYTDLLVERKWQMPQVARENRVTFVDLQMLQRVLDLTCGSFFGFPPASRNENGDKVMGRRCRITPTALFFADIVTPKINVLLNKHHLHFQNASCTVDQFPWYHHTVTFWYYYTSNG